MGCDLPASYVRFLLPVRISSLWGSTQKGHHSTAVCSNSVYSNTSRFDRIFCHMWRTPISPFQLVHQVWACVGACKNQPKLWFFPSLDQQHCYCSIDCHVEDDCEYCKHLLNCACDVNDQQIHSYSNATVVFFNKNAVSGSLFLLFGMALFYLNGCHVLPKKQKHLLHLKIVPSSRGPG